MGVGFEMKRKAVFLDRDGTLVKHVELLRDARTARFLPGVPAALRAMNRAGFLTIVITNQPVVARGLATEADIIKLHEALNTRLKKYGTRIDAFYFCPHHQEATRPEYRKKCRCRKPAPGMVVKAIREHSVDPEQSWMVGDALIDVAAGKHAGLKTILVKSGPGHVRLDKALADITPDHVTKTLSSAVRYIRGNQWKRQK